jgi:hypothetical protein
MLQPHPLGLAASLTPVVLLLAYAAIPMSGWAAASRGIW